MHCLITGGAGFIGSRLAERLLEEGIRVTSLDNFDPFYARKLKMANLRCCLRSPDFRLVEGDIRDAAALESIPAPLDCIVHLAAKAGVRPSLADPGGYVSVNVAGLQSMLEFARRRSVPQFVFASSSSVYGVNPRTPWSESDHVLLPVSPYAGTKVAGELMGHVYASLYGMRFLALRLFTVYGPRQRPDLAIRKFAEAILAGRPLPMFGDGSSSRDYTYVDDIVAGFRAAMDYRATNYEVINLGNSDPISLRDMIRVIEEALNRKATLDLQPPQPGDVPATFADIRKAGDLLGYRPATSFTEGVSRFVSWLRTHA
ncbi:MAG TPA: NAD-dependent epimerase/dehydratase family protein [Bryobacteraceae bacterium]|nr:NAD-dependent epimerase/dehydratase family protein [Bryobacteraceae bacterium]